MHIVIISPSDRSFIAKFLPNYLIENLPIGYSGAPFIGILIEQLLLKGHKVTAITTSTTAENTDQVKKFSNGNFNWVVVPARLHSFRMNGTKLGRMCDFFYDEKKMMVQAIKEANPDFIHAHWSYEFAGAAIKSGYPYLVTIHDNPFQILKYFKNLYRLFRLLMAEINLNNVRFASTVSPYMLPYASKKCSAVEFIPNPVNIDFNIEEITQLISQKSKDLSAPRLIMINNGWDKRKNGLSGLLAFKLLLKQYPDASLHLFGCGSEINGTAYQDVENLELQNVFFYGQVEHHELIEALQTMHILLHTALEESFGVVLIEAIVNGVLPIGGNSSGAVPWVLQDNKILVDVKKPDLIAEKISAIISNKDDYIKLLITRYQDVQSRFSATNVIGQYMDLYHKIMSFN